MKSIVTGGAGFIGSHLCDQLISRGHHVSVIDNLSCGRRKNIEHLLDQDNFIFHQMDIRDPAIRPLFDNVDWVFHLAGLADIVPSIEQPDNYFQTNVNGTFNVLECARSASVKRFMYAASSSCYGIPRDYPTPEQAEIKPEYPYALTKYMGEELVLHWNQLYKMPTVSLRLFNVYGPRSRTTGAYGAVFGVFLAQKINGKPFTVVGDGEQTRDFTFVTDVANAFCCAADSGISGEVFNVGSSNHYSVNSLAKLLKGDVEYIPKRPGEPNCTFADISKIQKLLDWEPVVTLKDGVEEMLKNIDDWKDAPVWNPDSISKATESWFKYLSNE
jgi:UDP-glucose 4-epimerase